MFVRHPDQHRMRNHLRFNPGGSYNLGAAGSTSGPDYRAKHGFFSGGLVVGNVAGSSPPYDLNNPMISGMVLAGNGLSHVAGTLGASSLFNGQELGYVCFLKDNSATTAPGIYNTNNALDYDLTLGVLHRAATREDILTVHSTGAVSLRKPTGAHLFWVGEGDLGSLDGGLTLAAPRDIYATRNVTLGGSLVVTASTTPATASSSGVAGRIVWDANYIYVCVATNTWKRTALSTW